MQLTKLPNPLYYPNGARRKSGHSSAIDAQTISTYDSNGEHNGLYRNYQQAWENLRFASPNSQPKSSGTPGVSLMGAHVVAGPAVGLKNFASPVSMAVGHHHLHQAHLLHGHHNIAMSGSSGASSSQSSSLNGSGGSGGGNTSGGADPLLRNHHHGHHHHHHRQSSRVGHIQHEVEVDEDELELESERGVLSSDETSAVIKAQYGRSGEQPGISGEGFRDTNELTINADTAMMTASQSGQNGGRRSRLYSVNSMSRERLSANLSESRLQVSRNHNHHGLHHHHSSSQHQRLVSTPSDSTRSSRASPPSDDQSLDRLAYGNNWSNRDQVQVVPSNHNSPSGQSHSAGSSASILGNGNNRANARFQ